MPICATPGCDNAVQYCSECDSETRGTRPRGFMILGTQSAIGEGTILVCVAEVTSVCENPHGMFLTLKNGGRITIKETLSEVAALMSQETD